MADYQKVATAIRATFRDGLRPWEYSKLATGMALEALLQHGGLAPMETSQRGLTAEDYERIERYLLQDNR